MRGGLTREGMARNWFLVLLSLLSGFISGSCLTKEGLALLAFRKEITLDPHDFLGKWSEQDPDPCKWPGVACSKGHVFLLNLPNLSLQGTIGAQLWELPWLQTVNLSRNCFSGPISPKLGNSLNLQSLDLSHNRLDGSIPKEIEKLVNLRRLHLNDNRLSGYSDQPDLSNLRYLQAVDFSYSLVDWKTPDCILVRNLSEERSGPARLLLTKKSGNGTRLHSRHNRTHTSTHHEQKHFSTDRQHQHRRRTLFYTLVFVLPVLVAVILVALVFSVFLYKRRTAAVSPWKSGMSGHLQRAFSTTEVPAVGWVELQSACEDFSNIIGSSADSVVFKGTLSDGTEVAVTSIRISASSWTASSEIFFRRKVEALARMKHTHLVNLLGFCSEEEPFARMLLFEYAPNGTLFDHLHNANSEQLDWPMRMRILMGAAYGLEYMHQGLVPPASHSNFDSNAIYLTEDYAAKLADFGISRIAGLKPDRRKSFSNVISYDDFEGSDRHAPDFESNIFSFGLFMLEVVTGRLPYSEKEGPLLEWALDFLGTEETIGYIVDPSLKNVDHSQLLVICDVVKLCINADPSGRPCMKTIVLLLAKGLKLGPEAARPKTSPLLWAELEILSP